MKKTPFRKQSLDEVKKKQQLKRQKALSKPKLPRKRVSKAKGKKTRKTKTPRAKANTDIWTECKRITRATGNTCYTCGAGNLEGSNWHCGHGKPKGALPLLYKYDIRNLKNQCYSCNIHYGGMTDVFIAKLEQEEEGLAFLEEACEKTDGVWRIKQQSTMGGKDGTEFLLKTIEEYKLL